MNLSGHRYQIVTLVCVLFMMTSCFDSPKKPISKSSVNPDAGVIDAQALKAMSPIVPKNFHQVHITMSTLTGISPMDSDIDNEYQTIKTQLPSTHQAEAMTGFNQIASTRLAAVYCDKYIDRDYDSKYKGLSAEESVSAMVDEFIDISPESNPDHKEFFDQALAIRNDEDEVLENENESKLLKMTCTAILSSAHVVMI